MAPISEPSVRRKRLGSALLALREAAKMTQEAAGEAIGKSKDTISRVESGKQKVDVPLLRTLLDVYKVDDASPLREALEAMTKNISARGWWHSYRSYLATAHQDFLGLESDAEGVREWEPLLVPGLLQHPAYTRALLAAGEGILHRDPEQLSNRVQVRMERKQVLDRPDFALDVIVSAAALQTSAGSAGTMRDQLNYLLDQSERPNVQLRVMPPDAGFHLGMDGAFTIIEFPGGGRLITLDSMVNTMYLEDEATLDAYDAAFARMRKDALSVRASRDAIREFARAA
ncbi:MAG: helix-turn-helix domain-containing protein [Streptomycetaceae bacterium]|nr:helix-turn-helix domain-containing protein [Streptomycetaceae bacterium]